MIENEQIIDYDIAQEEYMKKSLFLKGLINEDEYNYLYQNIIFEMRNAREYFKQRAKIQAELLGD